MIEPDQGICTLQKLLVQKAMHEGDHVHPHSSIHTINSLK